MNSGEKPLLKIFGNCDSMEHPILSLLGEAETPKSPKGREVILRVPLMVVNAKQLGPQELRLIQHTKGAGCNPRGCGYNTDAALRRQRR